MIFHDFIFTLGLNNLFTFSSITAKINFLKIASNERRKEVRKGNKNEKMSLVCLDKKF